MNLKAHNKLFMNFLKAYYEAFDEVFDEAFDEAFIKIKA